MIQLALGVVDAVPAERRQNMAQELLIRLAEEHGFSASAGTRHDELWEPAAEVMNNVRQLYLKGRLDSMLCGLPPSRPDADPLRLTLKAASDVAGDIGEANYRALAAACLDALTRWARANPILDGDEAAITR